MGAKEEWREERQALGSHLYLCLYFLPHLHSKSAVLEEEGGQVGKEGGLQMLSSRTCKVEDREPTLEYRTGEKDAHKKDSDAPTSLRGVL